MKKKSIHICKFSFRILGLTDQQVKLAIALIPKIKMKTRRNPKTLKSVVSYSLRPKQNYRKLEKFLTKERIPKRNFGVFVALTTCRDVDGVEFPSHVIELMQLGGRVDVSVVCL